MDRLFVLTKHIGFVLLSLPSFTCTGGWVTLGRWREDPSVPQPCIMQAEQIWYLHQLEETAEGRDGAQLPRCSAA